MAPLHLRFNQIKQMNYCRFFLFAALIVTASCQKNDHAVPAPEDDFFINEDAASFEKVGEIDIGGEAAAEISAYDTLTKKLFVVNNDPGCYSGFKNYRLH